MTKHEHRLTYLTGIKPTFQVSHRSGDACPLSRLRHSSVELKGCWRDVKTWQHCVHCTVIVVQIPPIQVRLSVINNCIAYLLLSGFKLFRNNFSVNVDHVAAASVITSRSYCIITLLAKTLISPFSTLYTPLFTLHASSTRRSTYFKRLCK